MINACTPALRTGHVFADTGDGPLWTELSDLEDALAQHLLPHPVGTIFVSGQTGWMLAEHEDGLTLMTGRFDEGELHDATSRFDVELDFFEVDDEALVAHLAVLSDAIGQLEKGHALRSVSVAPLQASDAQLRQLRVAVLAQDPGAQFVDVDETSSRRYIGAITALVGMNVRGVAQQLGRGAYAVHPVALPQAELGEVIQVQYQKGSEPTVKRLLDHERGPSR